MTPNILRTSLVLISLALAALALASCVEDLDDPSLGHAEAGQTNDEQPISVAFEAILPDGAETYTVNGIDYSVELTGVYLNAGNMTVLSKGDPVPAFDPESQFASLAAGRLSFEGFHAIDLSARTATMLAEVAVPVGWAGPVYLTTTEADRVTEPDNIDDVENLKNYMMAVEATLILPNGNERSLVTLVPGTRVFVLGAPGFRVDGSRTFTIKLDLTNWFGGIDLNTLSTANNTFFLTETENTAAWELVSTRALEALDAAEIGE